MADLGIFLAGLFVTLIWGGVVGTLIFVATTSETKR